MPSSHKSSVSGACLNAVSGVLDAVSSMAHSQGQTRKRKTSSSSAGLTSSTPRRNRLNSTSNRSIRFPASGAEVDPTAVFREITAGTSFERDEAMQGHLKVFADAFLNVAKTPEGQTMLFSLEGVGRGIKDRNGFVDSVKMMFRLAKKVGANPMVQFGLFLGFLGVITALVAHFGPVGLVGAGLQQVSHLLHDARNKSSPGDAARLLDDLHNGFDAAVPRRLGRYRLLLQRE